MKSKNEMIDDIMDNFDFNKVAKCMKALNWKWIAVPEGIPEESDIRKAARKLLQGVPETFLKDERYSGTGGLYVRSWYESTELVLIEMTFVVAEWRVDVNDL